MMSQFTIKLDLQTLLINMCGEDTTGQIVCSWCTHYTHTHTQTELCSCGECAGPTANHAWRFAPHLLPGVSACSHWLTCQILIVWVRPIRDQSQK